MAKRKSESLRVALVLDLDEYAKGLSGAKATAGAAGAAIGKGLGEEAAKTTRRFLSVEAASRVAERGLKAFARTAEAMEKAGRGTDGTAAVVRLSKSIDGLWESFVRAIVETDAAKWAIGQLQQAVEGAMMVITNFGPTMRFLGGEAKAAFGEIVGAMATVSDKSRQFIDVVRRVVTGAMIAPTGGVPAPAPGGLRATSDALIAAGQAESNAALAAMRAAAAQEEVHTKFLDATRGTVDAFMASWQNGLAKLGDLFRKFSGEAGSAFSGLSKRGGEALGEMFDGLALTGSLLQRIYGQSEGAAKKFAAAQMAITGALAVAKGLLAWGDSNKAAAEKDAVGVYANKIAATAYFAAAALSGVAASQSLSGGGGAGATDRGGVTNPEGFGAERKRVIVVIQNAIGAEDFVRREIIPEINSAVGDDVVILSTHSGSSDSLEPGRHQ